MEFSFGVSFSFQDFLKIFLLGLVFQFGYLILFVTLQYFEKNELWLDFL